METSKTSKMCNTSTMSFPQLELTGLASRLSTRGLDVLL